MNDNGPTHPASRLPAPSKGAARPGPPFAHPDLLWESMTTEPGVSVAILDERGTILFLNDETIRIFFDNKAPAQLRGMRLDELGFPPAWIEERLGIFREMAGDARPRLVRTIWHGHQQFSWVRMIPVESPGERPSFLVVTRRIPAGEESRRLLGSEHPVVESGVIRLGDLDVLSPRELEVLTLLGHGMAIRDIAQTLDRSAKTIERHRESIGAKLRQSKGVVLADLARQAGLALGDSGRTRV